MRIPKKIKPFYYVPGFCKEDFLQILDSNIERTLNFTDKPGILLSGGVDSSLLAIMAVKYYPDIPCFVVSDNEMNLDVEAAKRLAKERRLNLKVRLFNSEQIFAFKQKLKECIGSSLLYEGDECVFAALSFAAPIVTGIIATDGIDELMGGYWGHRDRTRFPDVKDAFKYFWDELEEKHLSPMCKSAKFWELDIIFMYLFPQIVEYISMIPLEDRIKGNIGKAIWKEVAELAGVPSWVIKRKKQGFVHAFN